MTLPICLGEFQTLTDGLDYAAQGDTGYNFYSLRGELVCRMPYHALRERAMQLSVWLANRFERNSRVTLVAETGPNFLICFMACQYAGIIPAPMPMPVNLGGKDGYLIQIRQMMTGAGACAAIGPEALKEFLADAAAPISGIELLSYEALMAMDEGDLLAGEGKPEPFTKDEMCYIQYSSGSTSAPKGVMGTQSSVTHNLRGIVAHGLKLKPEDRATSWLPLYHDMGLIGFALAPMFGQRSVDYISPSDFVRRPLLWPSLISRNGSSITYSPSFGYELAAKRASRADHASLDLAALRVAGIGGDMVRPEALNAFATAFADAGFDPVAFTPSYGMAEATLAIAFSELGKPYAVDQVDMGHYHRSGIAQPVSAITSADQKRAFVKCGVALPGHKIEVRNDAGKTVSDRTVGRIFIQGPSLTTGYFSDPEASAAMRHGEWLDTGDMGYMLDAEVIITGRAKDLIIINGRNIWPQDIEWAVERVENVRQGGVAAFSIDSNKGERIVVITECRGGLEDDTRQELRREIAQVVQATVGAPCEVVLVRPHSMVMTSSGKLSRAKVRDKYLAGVFDSETADGRGAGDRASGEPVKHTA